MACTAVRVRIPPHGLEGMLHVPPGAGGVVLFAHGSGSSRSSPRNRQVAARLQELGVGTLLFDLLGEEEAADRRLVLDIPLLAARLLGATAWLCGEKEARDLPVGYFGSSTGAAVALLAAATVPERVAGIVSRGGRVDLAGEVLERVRVPVLLLVGELDHAVLALNRQALVRLGSRGSLEIVPGAGHLFEEPGAMERVAAAAGAWFGTCFAAAVRPEEPDVH